MGVYCCCCVFKKDEERETNTLKLRMNVGERKGKISKEAVKRVLFRER